MKSMTLIAISLLSLGALANGALDGDDMIMSESLKRQGMPRGSYATSNNQSNNAQSAQRQVETQENAPITKESVQKMEEQIEVLERKVDRLEKNLARARSARRQEQKEYGKSAQKDSGEKMKAKKLEGLVFSRELTSPLDRGTIGKFSVHEGKAEAIASYEKAPIETRSIPALKVCTVMADANKMSVEDFAFMGLSRDAAMNAVSSRMRRGEFSSSKDLAEVDGIGPANYDNLEDKIIAIQSERFSE